MREFRVAERRQREEEEEGLRIGGAVGVLLPSS